MSKNSQSGEKYCAAAKQKEYQKFISKICLSKGSQHKICASQKFVHLKGITKSI